jgi:hypothetical protein
VARIAFRMLVTAGVGALLGLAVWVKGQLWAGWMADPLGLYAWPLGTSMLGGAVVGALLAFALDALGLDLPLFPQRQSRSETSQELAFSSYLAALQAAKHRGESLPPPPAPTPAPIRDTIRDWSSGSAEGWIDRDQADRIQERLGAVHLRLSLLLAASVATLVGIAAELIPALSAGALGSQGGGAVFFAIALTLCIAVFVLGGTVWRVIAGGSALAIAWTARFFLS